MASQVGATDNPNEPIAANTLNTTKWAGFGAIFVAVMGGLGQSLDVLDGQGASVKIALFATVAVAFVVAGWIVVSDMRVRNRQTVADNYLRYLRDEPAPAASQNGHKAQVDLSRVTVGTDGEPIGQLFVVVGQRPPSDGGDEERRLSLSEFVQLYG